jgi:hypothetical protein
MGRACGAHGGGEGCIQQFGWEKDASQAKFSGHFSLVLPCFSTRVSGSYY